MKLSIQRVPLDTLANFLLAIAAHPHSDTEVIADFAGGMSKATAKRAIPALIALGLVTQDNNGAYQSIRASISRASSYDQLRLVLKEALLGFRPFEAICEGINLGEGESEALRRTAIALSIENPDALSVLIRWGEELGILVRESQGLCLSSDLAMSGVKSSNTLSSRDIDSEAAARLYNARRLGRQANNFLDKTDRSLLAKAQMECQSAPDDALEKAGQALEDFLREVSNDKGFGVEAAKCNGAGQLGSMLVGKGLLHSHQNQIVLALGAARNMTAHHKDKKTLLPWDITESGARWGISGTLAIIRSIYEYIYGGKQTL